MHEAGERLFATKATPLSPGSDPTSEAAHVALGGDLREGSNDPAGFSQETSDRDGVRALPARPVSLY